jgi:hypothetical protein
MGSSMIRRDSPFPSSSSSLSLSSSLLSSSISSSDPRSSFPPPQPIPPNRTKKPINSIDELLRQCQSYQEPNYQPKKTKSENRCNKIEETITNLRHQEFINVMTKLYELVEMSNQKVEEILASQPFLFNTGYQGDE